MKEFNFTGFGFNQGLTSSSGDWLLELKIKKLAFKQISECGC